MRYLVATMVAVIVAAGGVFAYRALTPGPLPVNLAPPTGLRLSASGPISPGGWTNSHRVNLVVGNRGVAGVDVEIKPLNQGFNQTTSSHVAFSSEVAQNCRTSQGPPCPSSVLTTVSVSERLADGSYHWQARLHGSNGVSPWVPYKGAIRVDTRLPVVGRLSSPTDPDPATTYHNSTLRFEWSASDIGSGLDGYSYRLDSDPHGVPQRQVRTTDTTVTLNGLNSGTWYFHLSPLDRAGNWGSVTTIPVRIDVTPPGLTNVNFDRFDFDPAFQPLHVSFAVTRPARQVRVGVYRQNDNSLVRLYTLDNLVKGQQVTVAWDGKDSSGRAVPAGSYEIYVRAIDAYGHASVRGWSDFLLTHKRIVISLSQQKLVAYDGASVFLTSLVTTGNRALPTPVGTYSIMAKFHPFTFRSPWPKSSPFYYPPSKTEWTMLFREGGYFIHDAPWRSVFGPGSNSQVGTPGSNYTGTHGCVNVPNTIAQELFAWAPPGTTVQVVP